MTAGEEIRMRSRDIRSLDFHASRVPDPDRKVLSGFWELGLENQSYLSHSNRQGWIQPLEHNEEGSWFSK
jgi:hypothetical protein